MPKTRGGKTTWGSAQRNELTRRFALYHEDPTHPDGIPYERHLLHTDYTMELHAKIPLFAECDARYVTGPRGHINKRADLFRSDLEEAGARRPPPPAGDYDGSQAEEANEDEDYEEEDRKTADQKPAARGQRPVQHPPSASRRAPPVRNVDRGDPLAGAFRGLNFTAGDIMFFHYLYLWREGLLRLARNRCTIDMQLPGLVNLDEIDVDVVAPGDQVRVTIGLPKEVWLNSQRTAAQTVDGNNNQSLITSRVTSHQQTINEVVAEHGGRVVVTTLIDLPRRCELITTTRDDNGTEGAAEGSSIGAYEQDFQVRGLPKQYCFILHIQLLVKEDIVAQSSKPTGFVFGAGVGQQRQQQQQQQQQQQPQQQPFNFSNGWGSSGTTYGRPSNRPRRQR